MFLNLPLITLIVLTIRISNSIATILSIQPRAEDVDLEKINKFSSNPELESSINSCHSYYSELMQTHLETYKEKLKQCKNIESEKLGELFNEGQQHREITTKSLNKICAGFEECKAEAVNLDFFDCTNKSGDKGARGLWIASWDSLNNAAPIREKIHNIKYQTSRCSSEAERDYVIDITETTDEMMSCYSDVEERDQVEDIEDKDQVEELETKLKNRYEF